jgi:uncharacterized membrane-anchored protein
MNKKKTAVFIIFILVCLAQLFIITSMIWKEEAVLESGETFLFKIQPIDPHDYFRGKYINLNIAADIGPGNESVLHPLSNSKAWLNLGNIAVPSSLELKARQKIYVLIDNGPDGYARITNISIARPADCNYFTSRVNYAYRPETNSAYDMISIYYPFNRYYINEVKAPMVEKAYFAALTNQNTTNYIEVSIQNGTGALKEVYIDGLPIKEYMQKYSGTN